MIEESCVSFSTARMLKEAGFEEPCKCMYDLSPNREYKLYQNLIGNYMVGEDYYSQIYILAPSQALAARWLREVHRIVVDATFIPPLFDGVNWQYFIGEMDNMVWEGDFEPSDQKYATYEAALEAGLQEAIKLIKKKEAVQ